MTDTVSAAYATAHTTDGRARPSAGGAPLAAFLSFVFPGLGQLYNRQRGLAFALGVPVFALVCAAVVLYLFARESFVTWLFDTRFLVGLMLLNAVLLAWRLIAIGQAHLRRGSLSPRRGGTYATLAVALIAVAMHAVPSFYVVRAIETLDAVSLGGAGGGQGIRESFYTRTTPAPGESAVPHDQPAVELGERVNVLLVGLDQLPYREDVLTDTMLVVSLDPTTGRSAMLSIPRDIYGAPMPDGSTYDAKLNSLMTEASADPERYPLGGVGVLKATISELLDVPIHYFAAINLLGFKEAVDAIGGVDVRVEQAVADPQYQDEYGAHPGFFIEPGLHHMDGRTALAFVRSRQGEGDNDFTRAARQQQLLEALLEELTAGNLLTRLSPVLDAVSNTISTDIPGERIPALVRAVQDADIRNVEQIVLQPPDYVTPATGPDGAYILIPDVPAIRRLARDLIGD